jgi:hypothetical protein
MLTKKVILSVIVCLCAMNQVYSQQSGWMKTSREEVGNKIKEASRKLNDAGDTVRIYWRKGVALNVNVNQGSLTNWAAGGDKFSFSISSGLTAFSFYKKGRNAWDNILDLAYGYVNTTSLGGRKSDDRIDFTSKYGYDVGKSWYLSGLLNLRTQFSDGYLYEDNKKASLVSRFFSPAYGLVSPGMDFKPNSEFSLFISPITTRLVMVLDKQLSAIGSYGVDSGRTVKTEIGAYISVNWNKRVAENIQYKTRLDLFSDYKHNPQNINVYWTNALALKVNKHISANVSLDMIYDDNVKVFENKETGVLGPRLQIKQVIGVGLTASF